MYLLPAIVSTVAIALMFRRIYSLEPLGLVNAALGAVGLTPFSVPCSPISTPCSSPSPHPKVAVRRPLHADPVRRPDRGAQRLEEAARLDGASEFRVFTQIRFPYIRPVFLTTAIMAATYSLRGFDIPYLFTNGGPGHASGSCSTTYMYKTAFTSTNFGYASALSVFTSPQCILAVPPILLVRRSGEVGRH